MALKIIPSNERCPECYTTIEFEAADVVRTTYYVDTGQVTEDFIHCPYCGYHIILNSF